MQLLPRHSASVRLPPADQALGPRLLWIVGPWDVRADPDTGLVWLHPTDRSCGEPMTVLNVEALAGALLAAACSALGTRPSLLGPGK